MKRSVFVICALIFFLLPCSAIGFNVNLGLNSGLAESLGGKTVQKNINVWEAENNYIDYFSSGAYITTDLVFTQLFYVELGLAYKNLNLHYITTDENIYSNDMCHLNYSVIQIPVTANYIYQIQKSADIIDGISFGAGLNFSLNVAKQVYTDSLTKYYGKFISPNFNVGATLKATYLRKLGPGYAFAGLSSDINFIPNNYSISGQKVNLGNTLTVSPVIGYKFIIHEDKNLAKITEKNKRISDIDVR